MKMKRIKICTATGLPLIFLLCLFFLLAGFFGLSLLSDQEIMPRNSRAPHLRELAEKENIQFGELPRGDSRPDSAELIPSQLFSWNPRIFYFPNFTTVEQCDGIIKMAKARFKPSLVALSKGQPKESLEGYRTSASEDKTGILDQIERKIAKATMIPRTHGESFNIVRYEIGQGYKMHHDTADPDDDPPEGSKRVATFLLYLSDVEEGGETMFPLKSSDNMVPGHDSSKCVGIKVKPHRGDGLLFYSLFPNRTTDPMAIHGSCPAFKGEKWVAIKWIRDQELPEGF